MKCEKCVFWNSDGSKIGECRQTSPITIYDEANGSVCAHWPFTKDEDWCGEFQTNPYHQIPEDKKDFDLNDLYSYISSSLECDVDSTTISYENKKFISGKIILKNRVENDAKEINKFLQRYFEEINIEITNVDTTG